MKFKGSKDKYFYYIMTAVRQNMGLDEHDTSRDDEIEKMSKEEILDRVCEWDGLTGYGKFIKSWIEDIWGINLDEAARQQEAHNKRRERSDG